MSIIQICAAAVAGMLLAEQFKQQKPEYGIYISIAAESSYFLFCTRENRNNRGSNTKNRYIYIG